jgi:hypothetical protein
LVPSTAIDVMSQGDPPPRRRAVLTVVFAALAALLAPVMSAAPEGETVAIACEADAAPRRKVGRRRPRPRLPWRRPTATPRPAHGDARPVVHDAGVLVPIRRRGPPASIVA